MAARNVAAFKAELARERPVTLSIPVYNSWYESAETRRSGRITMRVRNEESVGGHAVCLVGYQDTPSSPGGGYFPVRNSWGTTWAYQSPYGAGYGTIPYQYVTNDAWEAYSAAATVDSQVRSDEQAALEAGASVTIEIGSNIKIMIRSS